MHLKQIGMFRDSTDANIAAYKLLRVLEYAMFGFPCTIDYEELVWILEVGELKEAEQKIVNNGLERYLKELGFINNKWVQG